MQAWLRASLTPTYEVEYEGLSAGPGAFAPVLRFLGLQTGDAERLASGLQKLQTKRQADVVENYAEIRAALQGTRYAALLES
jgi:hypothetical protein